ncbi:bifunctional hydroxymethylpyrimidine kinase/phosphomethylpyrimidine kinase [Streptococcaceae bacterium ESL0729]|nr:bifunctional hydroxymethylpyrimidine kinase/phosphomethylpyrimidine kinase [Streptococcaceae bacterium ESL0729]
MESRKVLTIAGSDILSGGGVQVDLATMKDHKVFSFMALTSLVTLNDGSLQIGSVDKNLFASQLESLRHVQLDAIKTGLLPNRELLDLTVDFLNFKSQEGTKIVVDPVLVFKENDDQEVVTLAEQMAKRLLPLADIISPNLLEAELLAQMEIKSPAHMVEAAKRLHALGAKNVVIKGGTRLFDRRACDLFYDGQNFFFLEKDMVEANNTGAGCALSSSIAANLALGKNNLLAVKDAKDYVYQAIKNSNEYGVIGNHEH